FSFTIFSTPTRNSISIYNRSAFYFPYISTMTSTLPFYFIVIGFSSFFLKFYIINNFFFYITWFYSNFISLLLLIKAYLNTYCDIFYIYIIIYNSSIIIIYLL